MIRVCQGSMGQCELFEVSASELQLTPATVWIDLYQPDATEERQVEKLLGLDVPTREEMHEIEASSRLYREGSATYMTATILANITTEQPVNAAVSFVLTPQTLITVRYEEPSPFRTIVQRLQRSPEMTTDGPETFLVHLLDTIADRAADILEQIGVTLDQLSRDIFHRSRTGEAFEALVRRLGQHSDIVSKVRESLVSLGRLAAFAQQTTQFRKQETARENLKVVEGDIASLNEHVDFLSSKITFLLDATLGLINIQQTAIIKFFSVVAVVFAPPTMIASIYGMNFKQMPELSWQFGYPLTLILMLLSMIAPYTFFKSKGWL